MLSSSLCCSFQSEDVDEEEIIPKMRQIELENKTTTPTVSVLAELHTIAWFLSC